MQRAIFFFFQFSYFQNFTDLIVIFFLFQNFETLSVIYFLTTNFALIRYTENVNMNH